MNWIVSIVLLGWSAIPITLLVVDRVFDVDSHRAIRILGWPLLLGSAALLIIVGLAESEYLELVGWGAFVGLVGTVALDIVRLIGLKAGAFPLDMPVVFGAMATGRVKRLQHLVMGRVLQHAIRAGTIEQFVAVRVQRLPHLSERQRINTAATMMGAISTLPEHDAAVVSQAQFTALSQLDGSGRQLVMQAMDAAGSGTRVGQPRGLPRVPMSLFRRAATAAIREFGDRDSVGLRRSKAVGYLWHVVNGVTFGIMYALIFGQGSWWWVLIWAVVVWLSMMVAMPFMMPTLELPAWFPLVPLVAHFAMVAPFLWLTSLLSVRADAVSLIGWLGW